VPYVSLGPQTERGEDLEGEGIWAMVRPRTRKDMLDAKRRSAEYIRTADHLYIRPAHLLCILCTAKVSEPLIQDNLVELRQRMEVDPDVPVTLTEGCCMVCDPCNVYRPEQNVCGTVYPKSPLRDLMVLEKLGLAPGATLSAKDLYRRVYDRIDDFYEICAWGSGEATAPYWEPCGGTADAANLKKHYDELRKAGLIAGKP